MREARPGTRARTSITATSPVAAGRGSAPTGMFSSDRASEPDAEDAVLSARAMPQPSSERAMPRSHALSAAAGRSGGR